MLETQNDDATVAETESVLHALCSILDEAKDTNNRNTLNAGLGLARSPTSSLTSHADLDMAPNLMEV